MWTVRMLAADAIPLATRPPARLFPGRPAAGARWKSALTDPAKRRLGPGGNRFRRRLMLAVTPGSARTLLMVTLAAQ